MTTIDIQVELEVVEVSFNVQNEGEIASFIILKLCIARPCPWLDNGSESSITCILASSSRLQIVLGADMSVLRLI